MGILRREQNKTKDLIKNIPDNTISEADHPMESERDLGLKLHTEQSKTEDLINVTDSAITKIYGLMEGEGNLDLKLRVYIIGGGCSGFQYGFSFEEQANDDDFVIERSVATENITDKSVTVPHIKVLIDAASMQYLKGAEIDYKKDINGEQFIIRNNPNAKTTCGCGSSFSADISTDS
jgi:iron-sulfur cluster insertion protein